MSALEERIAGEKNGLIIPLQHGRIQFVNDDLSPGGVLQGLIGVHVVKMAVRINDVFQREIMVVQGLQDFVLISPGVDDHCFLGLFVPDDVTVDFQESHHQTFLDHSTSTFRADRVSAISVRAHPRGRPLIN